MQRSALSRLHPVCSFTLLGSLFCLSFLTEDPLLGLLLGAGALLYFAVTCGFGFAARRLGLLLLLTAAIALTNPLFSHRGATVLFYLGQNPVTLEAVFFGVQSGLFLGDMLLWCGVFYRSVPLEAQLFVLGKALPRCTLVVTLAVRFVPLLIRRVRDVRLAQEAFHPKTDLRHSLSVLQTALALTLEECCEIAASMEGRGYGAGKRSSYSLYRFTVGDGAAALAVLTLFALTLAGVASDSLGFTCYPVLRVHARGLGWLWYLAPALLSLIPALLEEKEKLAWHTWKSKT